MSEPFLSEIRMMSFDFPPKGWAQCNGQFLPINQNQALFALLGTNYGGNGQTTFALPDLRNRVPIHQGDGRSVGVRAGEAAHTVTQSEMPQHAHVVQASSTGPAATNPTVPSASRRLSRSAPGNLYGPATNLQAMNPAAVGTTGGSQAHTNQSPYLKLNFCIALQGIFPSQN